MSCKLHNAPGGDGEADGGADQDPEALAALRANLSHIVGVLVDTVIVAFSGHRWPVSARNRRSANELPPLSNAGPIAVLIYNDDNHTFNEVNDVVRGASRRTCPAQRLR